MSKKHHSRPAAQPIEDTETAQPDVVEEAAPVVRGVVVDCHKLNVRRAPSVNATVLCKIASDTEVVIDESKSKNDWYSVCTEAGIEGFCMKKYIAISQ